MLILVPWAVGAEVSVKAVSGVQPELRRAL
jgi:hypothetical protein